MDLTHTLDIPRHHSHFQADRGQRAAEEDCRQNEEHDESCQTPREDEEWEPKRAEKQTGGDDPLGTVLVG